MAWLTRVTKEREDALHLSGIKIPFELGGEFIGHREDTQVMANLRGGQGCRLRPFSW